MENLFNSTMFLLSCTISIILLFFLFYKFIIPKKFPKKYDSEIKMKFTKRQLRNQRKRFGYLRNSDLRNINFVKNV